MSGFRIDGTDISDMVAIGSPGNGRNDNSSFRDYFKSTSGRSLPSTSYNPTNCQITNSVNQSFNCYRVANNFTSGRYKDPAGAEDWSFAGYSWRYDHNPAYAQNATPITNSAAPKMTAWRGQWKPGWCNHMIIMSVGGGGAGGAKGASPSYGGGDGTNGLIAVEHINVTNVSRFDVIVGAGGSAGNGTGNNEGSGFPGARSYVQFGNGDNNSGQPLRVIALGGAGGNESNSNGSGGRGNLMTSPKSANTGLRIVDGNVSGAVNADNGRPGNFPPTDQINRAAFDREGFINSETRDATGIGGYGFGGKNGNNNPGRRGNNGMVAIFFKNKDASNRL